VFLKKNSGFLFLISNSTGLNIKQTGFLDGGILRCVMYN